MPLDLPTFAQRYPWLWHVTTAANAERIARLKYIACTATLLRDAGREDLLDVRRREPVPLTVDGAQVVLRDQAPLHEGHIAWEPCWELQRFVAALNARVFFWPGHRHRPSTAAGANAINFLYSQSDAVVVLVPTAAIVLEPHPPLPVELARVNTGGPRTSGGHKSPRGGSTFVRPEQWIAPPSKVREVVVAGGVDLAPFCDRVLVQTAGSFGDRPLLRGAHA